MTYSTKPYLPFTLFVPNHAKSFEVSLDRLWVRVLGEVDTEIALPLSSVTRSPGIVQALLHTLLNRGSLDLIDAGGAKHTLYRVQDVRNLRSALAGTHPAIVAEVEEKTRLERLRNVKEEDLADWVIYYPHIPKAVDRLLRGREPDRYHDGAYTNLMAEGSVVRQGQVIARYGTIQITSPFDGRLEMLGEAKPGLHEWPDPQKWNRVDGTDDERKTANLNSGALVFPPGTPEKEAHAFALRPLRDPLAMPRSEYSSFFVRNVFDHGQVWLDMKRKKGDTFYTIIDLAVYDLESPGSGISLPDSLRRDQAYRKELARYWKLINSANAKVKVLGCDDARRG